MSPRGSSHPFCTLESAFFKVVYAGCVTELTQIDNPTRRWGINGCDGWWGGWGGNVHKDKRRTNKLHVELGINGKVCGRHKNVNF